MKRVSIFIGVIFMILILIAVAGYQFFRYMMRPTAQTGEITITLVPIPDSERNFPAEIDGIKKRSAEIESHIHQLQDEISAEQTRLKVLQTAQKNIKSR